MKLKVNLTQHCYYTSTFISLARPPLSDLAENGQQSGNHRAIPSASSTDLDPYMSQSTDSTPTESTETVRPESEEVINEVIGDELQRRDELGGSYAIDSPSIALTQHGQTSEPSSPTKPHFGHLGSMVARYLTEQQRVKHRSEFAKLQSILRDVCLVYFTLLNINLSNYRTQKQILPQQVVFQKMMSHPNLLKKKTSAHLTWPE